MKRLRPKNRTYPNSLSPSKSPIPRSFLPESPQRRTHTQTHPLVDAAEKRHPMVAVGCRFEAWTVAYQ